MTSCFVGKYIKMSLTIPKILSESFNMTFLLYHGHVNYVTRYASNDIIIKP